MCLYQGIYYHECGHCHFLVQQFCERLYYQLQRINDPEQRRSYIIPFDGAGCEPRVRWKEDGSLDFRETSFVWSNVMRWEHNVAEVCRECRDEGVLGIMEVREMIL